MLKELSGSDPRSLRDRSVSLYSRSDFSGQREKRRRSQEKGIFWKSHAGEAKGKARKSEAERKRSKMKLWVGKLKLKQVENPSIGLDLSHRSKSIGPRRDWKEEKAIREELEPEESASPGNEPRIQIQRISSYQPKSREGFLGEEMRGKGEERRRREKDFRQSCNFEIFAGKFDAENEKKTVKETRPGEKERKGEVESKGEAEGKGEAKKDAGAVAEMLARVRRKEETAEAMREQTRVQQLEAEVRALERETAGLKGGLTSRKGRAAGAQPVSAERVQGQPQPRGAARRRQPQTGRRAAAAARAEPAQRRVSAAGAQ